MELDVEARIALEVAAFDAARRGGGAVTPLHVLSALRFDATGADAFRGLVASPVELAALIEAELTERGGAHAYRSGGARASEWLDRFLERAWMSSSHRFWQLLSRAHLLEAIASEPAVRSLVARCTSQVALARDVDDERLEHISLRELLVEHHAKVRQLLERELGVPAAEAMRLVLTASHVGRAYVGAYDGATRRALVVASAQSFAPNPTRAFLEIRQPPAVLEATVYGGVMRRALDAAARHGHATVRLAHVVAGFVDAPAFADAFAATGASIEEARAAVEAEIAALRGARGRSGVSRAVDAWGRAVRGKLLSSVDISLASLFASLPPKELAVAAVTAVSPRFELLFALAHGVAFAPIEPTSDASTREEVVLHDDDVTTMDFVTGLLEDTFDLAPEDARFAMLRVHEAGLATVGAYPACEARRLAKLACERARQVGTPLRVTVRPTR